MAEDVLGGFALAYKVLSRFEENGRAMRGYVIEGLGAAQFSTPAVIDRLRGLSDTPDLEGWPSGTAEPLSYLLAAADPANPYGAALPWPESGPSRAAGASVILVDGLLLAHLTRGGRSLHLFLDSLPGGIPAGQDALVAMVVDAIREAVLENMMSRVVIEKVNGKTALTHPLLESFRVAGAGITPKGIRVGGTTTGGGARRGRRVTEALAELPAPGDPAEPPSFDDPPANPFGGRPRRR